MSSPIVARLLAVGDVHLGRRPGGLPRELERDPALSPRAALERAIELALRERPDAVLFAGDLVEASNRFFEGYAALAPAVKRLTEAGLQVLAVAGNHDVEVLPRLARELPGLRLLGAGGTWESVPIVRDGETVARVVGWSFPAPRVTSDPWASFRLPPETDAARIGLLHADLDATTSQYAPVRRSAIASSGLDAVLLGHVHVPSALDGPQPIGYLGSISALDASETGPHGVWRIEVDTARRVRARLVPLAPLRFESATLAAASIESPSELDAQILRLARRIQAATWDEEGERSPAALRALGLRLSIVGPSPFAATLGAQIERLDRDALSWLDERGAVFVASVQQRLWPHVSLPELARADDAPALLAQLILALRGGAVDAGLWSRLVSEQDRVARDPAWAALAEEPLPTNDSAAARERLLAVGERLLGELLEQGIDDPGSGR